MPMALRVAKGEKPYRIHDVPQPRSARPVMPSDMSEEAKVVWRRVMREFGAAGVITVADTDTFRAYCEAVAGYVDATTRLAATGLIVRGQKGEIVRNPLVQIQRDYRDGMRLLARELGLTPSARTGLRTEKGETLDPMAEFLARRRTS